MTTPPPPPPPPPLFIYMKHEFTPFVMSRFFYDCVWKITSKLLLAKPTTSEHSEQSDCASCYESSYESLD